MKARKKTIMISLMLSSMILLVTLQVLWLRKEYDNAYENLRKESNFIFRTTLRTLMDSLIQRSIRPLNDSTYYNEERWTNGFRGLRYYTDSRQDSSSKSISITNSKIEVYLKGSPAGDSLENLFLPSVPQFERREAGQTFVIRVNNDSLKVKDIEYSLMSALEDAMIQLPVKVQRVRRENRNRDFHIAFTDKQLFTDFVPAGPFEGYVATLSDFRPSLLKAITPQFLFSLFLTLLTGGSFIVLYRSLRTQVRLMEIKNDFISNISHELKTPVATVSVAIEALRNFDALKNPNLTNEYLDIAQSELNRLSLMTDKILKTAVFEKNGVSFISEPVDLKQTIELVIGSVKLLVDQKQGKISFSTEGENFIVNGNHAHLTNVIFNLIDNAIKYSGNNPVIDIQLKENQEFVAFSIRDNGVGIHKEYLPKIFEKFFRVPKGDVHDAKGYGLGLSYVYSIIKSHKGKINVESELGKGSTFTVSIPI